MVTMTDVLMALKKIKHQEGSKTGGFNYKVFKRRVVLLAEVLNPEERKLVLKALKGD